MGKVLFVSGILSMMKCEVGMVDVRKTQDSTALEKMMDRISRSTQRVRMLRDIGWEWELRSVIQEELGSVSPGIEITEALPGGIMVQLSARGFRCSVWICDSSKFLMADKQLRTLVSTVASVLNASISEEVQVALGLKKPSSCKRNTEKVVREVRIPSWSEVENDPQLLLSILEAFSMVTANRKELRPSHVLMGVFGGGRIHQFRDILRCIDQGKGWLARSKGHDTQPRLSEKGWEKLHDLRGQLLEKS